MNHNLFRLDRCESVRSGDRFVRANANHTQLELRVGSDDLSDVLAAVDSPHAQTTIVIGLDRLNPYNDPQPDGNFDYVEGITINCFVPATPDT